MIGQQAHKPVLPWMSEPVTIPEGALFIIFIPHRRNLGLRDVMALLGMAILINSKAKICTQASELCF